MQENRKDNNEPAAQKPVNEQRQLSQTQPVKPSLRQTAQSMGRSINKQTGFSRTGFAQTMYMQKRTMDKLRAKLYFDERTKTVPKTTLKNNIIENIVQDYDVFLKKNELMDSVYKLKQLNLLKQHDTHINKYRGVGKTAFVYNDYHSKSTNNGFSRNFGGVFYTR